MVYLIQILFFGLNIAIAAYQARLFAANKSISHALWAAAYCLLIVPVWFWQRNWALCAALIIQRLPVFNTALNLFRHKPFFYTGSASVLDKLFSGWYPVVFFISLAALVAVQFFIK